MRPERTGLFPLDPPPGGWMRLRSRLRPESEAESRWYALLPVASAALIAVAVIGPWQAHVDLSERIVSDVRMREQPAWVPLASRNPEVGVYLAQPVAMPERVKP
jgi:hypothetical protein